MIREAAELAEAVDKVLQFYLLARSAFKLTKAIGEGPHPTDVAFEADRLLSELLPELSKYLYEHDLLPRNVGWQ
jgi:hypothetical protein